ncbi:hypothetical protein [Azospirillum thermophilum]|nr:hypothetical protein [Azospirillum thermophilum]
MNRKSLLGDPPPIRITPRDLGLLDSILSQLSRPSPVVDFLQRELDRASVEDAAPAPSSPSAPASPSTTTVAAAIPPPFSPPARCGRTASPS